MKNYIRLIPLTGLAAAIALGGPLSAAETGYKNTSKKDQDRQSERSSRNYDKTNQAITNPMMASDILGMNIDTTNDETIGEIEEIFIDINTGKVLAVGVSTGGFLGMGEEQTLISLEDLRLNTDRTYMLTDLSEDQLEAAPRYEEGEVANLDGVHPLGKARSNWDARDERADMRSSDRAGQKVSNDSNRATASKERTDWNNRTDRTGRYESDQPDNGRDLALSDLIGMDVENRQGETVGEVDEVFLDLEKGEVAGVVVSTGGFLGMGDHKNLFTLRELAFDSSNENVVLDYNRDQILELPEYNEDDQSLFADLGERTERLGTRIGNYMSGDDDYRNEDRNARRSSDKTILDQGNSSDEIAMTAAIRTAILEDSALSNRANNVTVITKNGKVVLRGKVNSESEKNTIENIAHEKAGRTNVTSELVVASR